MRPVAYVLLFFLNVLLASVATLPGDRSGSDAVTVCARPNAGFLTEAEEGPRGLELDLLESFASAQGLVLEHRRCGHRRCGGVQLR